MQSKHIVTKRVEFFGKLVENSNNKTTTKPETEKYSLPRAVGR